MENFRYFFFLVFFSFSCSLLLLFSFSSPSPTECFSCLQLCSLTPFSPFFSPHPRLFATLLASCQLQGLLHFHLLSRGSSMSCYSPFPLSPFVSPPSSTIPSPRCSTPSNVLIPFPLPCYLEGDLSSITVEVNGPSSVCVLFNFPSSSSSLSTSSPSLHPVIHFSTEVHGVYYINVKNSEGAHLPHSPIAYEVKPPTFTSSSASSTSSPATSRHFNSSSFGSCPLAVVSSSFSPPSCFTSSSFSSTSSSAPLQQTSGARIQQPAVKKKKKVQLRALAVQENGNAIPPTDRVDISIKGPETVRSASADRVGDYLVIEFETTEEGNGGLKGGKGEDSGEGEKVEGANCFWVNIRYQGRLIRDSPFQATASPGEQTPK
jgi:hypothetical protein